MLEADKTQVAQTLSQVPLLVEDLGTRLQVTLSERKISGKFIAKRAPWWGGFYAECIKTPLKEIFPKVMLDTEQPTTILA